MKDREEKVIVFFSGELQQGGAERVIVTLANFWAKRQSKIIIITIDGKPSFYPLDMQVEHIKLGLTEDSRGNVWRGIKENGKRVINLRQLLRIKKVDVLISFITDANIIALIASFGLGIKVLVSDRTSPYAEWDFTNHYKLYLKKCIYRLASYVVVQTEKVTTYYHNWLPSRKIIVINNPLPAIFCTNIVEKNLQKFLILAVGRLQTEKNFGLLIESFSQINSVGWSLVIVGEGNEREKLSQLIKEKKAELNIQLVGSATNMIDWYSQASIFVLSSLFEGYPNVLIEAMAMGLPVISTNCDYGPSEIIENGKNGLLVPMDNVEAMRNTLEKLMANATLRTKMGIEAQKIREKLNIEQIAKQWEALM